MALDHEKSEHTSATKPSKGNTIVRNRDLVDQCILFQKRRVWLIGPLMVLLCLWGYWMLQEWKLLVILGILTVTQLMFIWGLQLAKRGIIENSLWMAVVPTLATCMSVVVLMDGFDLPMTLTAISLVVQTSVFSKRISVVGAGGILILVITSLILDRSLFAERLVVRTDVALIASTLIAIVMVIQFWVYLRRHHDNSLGFVEEQLEMSRVREDLLNAVSAIVPDMDTTVSDVTRISKDVANRSQGQAGAAELIADLLVALTAGSNRTTESAQQSVSIAKGMHRQMADNHHRLQEVSKTSENVVANMHDARRIMGALVSQTENIEKILSYNRSIGEQIKVLSVNASIEAAAAGENGAGFAVVARELTEMIESTEKNLFESAAILNDIRNQSKAGMTSIDATSNLFEQFISELMHTRETLEKAVANANAAARQSERIVEGIEQQQQDLNGVGDGSQTLLDSAFDLAVSSAQLEENVAKLNDLRRNMTKLLK
ncbi:MAG: methyl-accepting chemotaxis protein [Deltaproteobacteria bacterium]|nr:methyl-accepting chemotaxis protein [Deltaproteobacteria bacterium]